MFAGILISPFDPTVILKSVPSDSIFSAVAVRLILFPAIVKSVPSPSIFSPSLPKVSPVSYTHLTLPTKRIV